MADHQTYTAKDFAFQLVAQRLEDQTCDQTGKNSLGNIHNDDQSGAAGAVIADKVGKTCVAAAVVSSTIAYYTMWALAAVIFCMAVYYTVKQL